mmetsp:Transcript_8028/g.14875  ORF Transcript_8028/g.14875 Transcript_8028/m.14875 type:complete len:209 (-) Transcript_8028:279-905(-)
MLTGDDFGRAHLIKLVLIGDSGVGKTSILSRFVDNDFNDNFYSTIGVDFKARTMTVGDEKVKIQVWDTAGQERFRTITSSYYRGAKGIMIVFNVADRLSFENANVWLREANKFSNDSVKILVGNKADVSTSQRQVSFEEAREYALKVNMPFIETSAKLGQNVHEAFQLISQDIMRRQSPESENNGEGSLQLSELNDRKNKAHSRKRCC